MEGRRNGGDVGLWSWYRDQTTRGSRSTSSSGYTSAGTIVSISTGYTSNSSRLSSISSLGLEAAIHMELELDEDRSRPTKKSRNGTDISKEIQKKEEVYYYSYLEITKDIEEIKILIQEFLAAQSPSDDCSLKDKGGNIGVLDWWLKHLGVGWVLNVVDDYVSAGKLEHTFDHARSWTRALAKITQTIQFIACNAEKESIPDLFQFAHFIQETMLKLLIFVDVILEDVRNQRAPHDPILADLFALLVVHDALPEALSAIRWLFKSPPFGGVERTKDKIVGILSEKQTKVAQAIWSTMKQILMESTKDRDNLSCSLDTQESSDVHKVTLFVVTYIRLLYSRYWSVVEILSESASHVKYVPQHRYTRPLESMIREIVSCLQETLANRSQFFPDRGLGFLFLLNNLYFIRQELPVGQTEGSLILEEIKAALFGKVGDYVNSYLQVSWAPILSSLLNPTPVCFKRNYSPLLKFEDEFRKTYTTQKLWKVPDPQLRKRLRNAIIVKIIPSYTKYIEENKISTTKSSPDEMKEMLEQLFEG